MEQTMKRFGNLDQYPDIFKHFLNEVVNYAINEANNNGGKYIASWVVNKSNPHENMKFEWRGEALVQDAIHDAGRAVGEWQTTAIEPLKNLWGLSADVDFEKIKRDFMVSMKTEPIEVNSMFVPSTLDQGDVIGPYLPRDCIHTFDNGAKKSPQFGAQYVTQATIYDTGNTVQIRDNIMPFPPEPVDFQNFGTLTITVMPMCINTICRLQVFVIFSHGRYITETTIGMEGFMEFFDAEDTQGPSRVSIFTEASLNANIGPVSAGKYLNNGVLQSSTHNTMLMPNYFAEIIKFIADRNQCIMSGYFSNLPNDQISRFYSQPTVSKLMLVSGDRYSLEEIYRFMKENGVYIPFTYFGASRYERHFEKDDNEQFILVSSPSRCLFSVRKKGDVEESPEMRLYMSQIRELTNLVEKANELSAKYEVDLQTAEMEMRTLERKSDKASQVSTQYYERAEDDLRRIQGNARLMQSIKDAIQGKAIDNLSLSYQSWVAHEEHERVILAQTEQFKQMELAFKENAEFIEKTNELLVNLKNNLLANQSEVTEESTSFSEVDTEGRSFNNTTRVIDTDEGPRMQDVASGYIYDKDEAIMTLQESLDRQNELENEIEFGIRQHKRGGMKRTAKNRRFNYSRKNIDGWMVIDFFKNLRRPLLRMSKHVRKTRRSIKKVKPAPNTISKSKPHKKSQMKRKK